MGRGICIQRKYKDKGKYIYKYNDKDKCEEKYKQGDKDKHEDNYTYKEEWGYKQQEKQEYTK